MVGQRLRRQPWYQQGPQVNDEVRFVLCMIGHALKATLIWFVAIWGLFSLLRWLL